MTYRYLGPWVERLGTRLLRKHGLGDWQVMTKPMYRRIRAGQIRTVGYCYPESKRIVIATEWTQSKHLLRIFLLHEIAHAIAGRDRYNGHGPRWQATARELGVPAWNIRAHAELATGTPTLMRSGSGKFQTREPSRGATKTRLGNSRIKEGTL